MSSKLYIILSVLVVVAIVYYISTKNKKKLTTGGGGSDITEDISENTGGKTSGDCEKVNISVLESKLTAGKSNKPSAAYYHKKDKNSYTSIIKAFNQCFDEAKEAGGNKTCLDRETLSSAYANEYDNMSGFWKANKQNRAEKAWERLIEKYL